MNERYIIITAIIYWSITRMNETTYNRLQKAMELRYKINSNNPAICLVGHWFFKENKPISRKICDENTQYLVISGGM